MRKKGSIIYELSYKSFQLTNSIYKLKKSFKRTNHGKDSNKFNQMDVFGTA